MREYWKKIYETRYFWSHLAKNDLKFKFRRSKLGMLWIIAQPFFLTIIMAIVFSTVFKQDLGEYALYILSGMVVWDMLNSAVVAYCNSIVWSEQYIRQFNHPITIYTLRYSVLNIATFVIEINALVLWVLFMKPINLILAFFTVPLTVIVYFPMIWAITTISSYANTKYRDFPQVMALIMQALWYISPVFFKQEQFANNKILTKFFDINPITHILNMVRNPFVYGKMPELKDYVFCLATTGIFVLWAYKLNKNNQKNIIFYL